MKTYLDCLPCFAKQGLDALRLVTDDKDLMEETLREIMKTVSEMSYTTCPPVIGREVHKIVREKLGVKDPYYKIKKASTKKALEAVPIVKNLLKNSKNSLELAIRFSIAGNIMDYALTSLWDEKKIEDSLGKAIKQPISDVGLNNLISAIEDSKTILILGDNAGETVFDKLLIEQLKDKDVTYAVKGGPVINDAVLEDALDAKIDEVAQIIDNGSDAPGTILEFCSESFKEIFYSSDLVISKGQANYETICDADRKIYFLTQIKCPIIEDDLGGKLGDWIVSSN